MQRYIGVFAHYDDVLDSSGITTAGRAIYYHLHSKAFSKTGILYTSPNLLSAKFRISQSVVSKQLYFLRCVGLISYPSDTINGEKPYLLHGFMLPNRRVTRSQEDMVITICNTPSIRRCGDAPSDAILIYPHVDNSISIQSYKNAYNLAMSILMRLRGQWTWDYPDIFSVENSDKISICGMSESAVYPMRRLSSI
jgi:hypothetical protein